MDNYQKLAVVEILDTFESLKKEPLEELSELHESTENEDLRSIKIESISCDITELECEANCITSQKICIKEYNTISELPKSSISLKAEDINYEKISWHKHDISSVDFGGNPLDNVDPLTFPDSKLGISKNVVKQLVVCKSEIKERENTLKWNEDKFDIGNENKTTLMKRECVREEEFVKYKDEEITIIKTEGRETINPTDVDLNYSAIDDDDNTRKEEKHLLLPDVTGNCGKPSEIIYTIKIVNGDLKLHPATSVAHTGKDNEYTSLQWNQCKKSLIKDINLERQLPHEGIHPYESLQYKNRSTLNAHLKTHLILDEGMMPYECPQTKEIFSPSASLKTHSRIDKGIHPHECPQCKKRFILSGALKRHLRIHKGLLPYECPECKKTFTQSEHLKMHLRIHEEIHPYECPQCKKRFAHSGTLKSHLKIYESHRPYECPQCKKRFAESESLTTHLRIHNEIRPYECPQCKKIFAKSETLKSHLKICLYPYKCPQCKKTFILSGALKRHLRFHSTNVLSARERLLKARI